MKHIDIVFDGPPGETAGRFVDVENECGGSIKLGEWVERDDGYWALRISDAAYYYQPYPEDQALAGPDRPSMKTILDVIRYCTTVHSRFGNTCVEGVSLKWGASALNARDDIKQLQSDLTQYKDKYRTTEGELYKTDKRIEQLEAALGNLIKSCQAIIDNRHEDLGEREDVEPYLKNRLMIAREALEAAGRLLPMTEKRKIWGELYIDDDGKANLDCHIHSSVKFGEAEAALIKFVELLQGQIDRKDECPLHIQEKK